MMKMSHDENTQFTFSQLKKDFIGQAYTLNQCTNLKIINFIDV